MKKITLSQQSAPIHILFLFLLAFTCSLYSQEWQWETFTSSDEIRQTAGNDSLIWCATNGGVLKLNIDTISFEKFTNTEGLSANDILAVAVDSKNNVWAADEKGLLNFYNSQENKWEIKSHYRNQIINSIYPFGDSLFIAFNEGVSLFVPNPQDPQGWEVKETYYIGASNQIIVADEIIWVLTDEAILKAELGFPNLQAPSAWTELRKGIEIPGSQLNIIYKFKNLYYIGTDAGLFPFDGVNVGAAVLTTNVISLDEWNGQLTAMSTWGIHSLQNDGTWKKIGSSLQRLNSMVVDNKNMIWAGTPTNGLALLDETTDKFITIKSNGPVENKFNALTFDLEGNLWVASNNGLSYFNGEQWETFDKNFGLKPSGGFQDVEVDIQNRLWAANWGSGVSILEKVDDQWMLSQIDNVDNQLAGTPSDNNYVVTTGLEKDLNGNMWILNSQANTKKVVAVVDMLGNWQYFSTLEGINSTEVISLAMDSHNRLWVGTEHSGISVLDFNETPFSKDDDDLSQGLTTADGLESEKVRCLAEDLDGVMWIATPEGLDYWFDGNVYPKYGTISDDINCVLVDAANNKWIGTSGGLTLLNSDGFQMSHYSTDNSPLPANNITSLAFNEATGEMYIGTTNGLSRLTTPFTKPASTLSLVKGYPNPFFIDGTGKQFTIDNLAYNSKVNIYTAEGFLVRKFSEEQVFGARLNWDGRNDKNEIVASGVYIYFVTTDKGLTKAGKVAVIRP